MSAISGEVNSLATVCGDVRAGREESGVAVPWAAAGRVYFGFLFSQGGRDGGVPGDDRGGDCYFRCLPVYRDFVSLVQRDRLRDGGDGAAGRWRKTGAGGRGKTDHA